jgi:hypothetical protein
VDVTLRCAWLLVYELGFTSSVRMLNPQHHLLAEGIGFVAIERLLALLA